MQGDLNDILFRLRQVLPLRWFPDSAPVLDMLLTGIARMWCWSFAQLQAVKSQTRISTATGVWLDVIARDYFGSALQRRPGESDARYSLRIRAELVRERGTRKAVESVLLSVSGRSPVLFEPANTSDTGGYAGTNGSGGGIGYGSAGGWGSLALPFQFFVTAYRPTGSGIAAVSGWARGGGAYGEGALEYGTASMLPSHLEDADLYAAIASVLPIGTIAWTQISS